VGAAAAAFTLLASREAAAVNWVIKNPSDHPEYRVELEPHGMIVPWGNWYGYGYRGGPGWRDRYAFHAGAGFRATIEIVDPVIPRINNTIGITFGIDFAYCGYCYPDEFALWFPVGAQWNFFLTKKWSVFAEIGVVPHSNGFFNGRYADAAWVEPMFEIGTRWHFRDKITLTGRVGIPFITIGVSFLI
jgi:hypothetical protein